MRSVSCFRRSAVRPERAGRAAFTLIELMIAASIAGIVGLAIIFSFAAGLKAYSKVKDFNTSRPGILISLEKIERDLSNTFRFTGIDFAGDKKKISFAGFLNENFCIGIGRISYFFNANDGGALIRAEQPYSYALLENKPDGIKSRTAAALKDVVFSYCYFSPDSHRYDWRDSWSGGDGIPRAVKIRVVFREGDKDLELERTVFIPVSG